MKIIKREDFIIEYKQINNTGPSRFYFSFSYKDHDNFIEFHSMYLDNKINLLSRAVLSGKILFKSSENPDLKLNGKNNHELVKYDNKTIINSDLKKIFELNSDNEYQGYKIIIK